MYLLHLDKNHDYLISKLDEIGFKNDIDLLSNKTEIEKKIYKYSGLIIRSRIPIDDTFIKKATNLKFIARVGSGLENIDIQSAKTNNIEVISAGEANANAVGEHIIGLLFSLINKINISSIQVRKGIWKREQNRGFEIEGKTVGIIGFGKTGKSFAKKLTGFNCNVLYYDIKNIPSEYNATPVDLKILKEKSDIISIHTDYNESSHNMINSDFVNMKLYPNPTKGEFVIDFSKSINELEILIYDINGRVVEEYKLENKSRINLNPKVSAGLYFIKIISSSQSIIFKLIKK